VNPGECRSAYCIASGDLIFYIFSDFERISNLNHFLFDMHVRRLCSLVAAICLIPAVLFGQVLSVQLKVRESRLFGLSGERFATLELANQNRTVPLTSENVNGGPNYFFIFRPVGEWVLDADFVKDELTKLTLQQDTQVVQIVWKEEILGDSTASSILIGFPKELKIHRPFEARFQLADSAAQGTFDIPQEYWPGYPLLTSTLQSIDQAATGKHYRDAIACCGQALQSEELQIFPQVKDLRDRRTHIFEAMHTESAMLLASVNAPDKRGLKEKIAQLDEIKPVFQYILDSLTSVPLNVAATDSAVRLLLDHTTTAAGRTRALRDSLQLVLDDQNVRWILDGSVTGKNGDRYQSMIEILAYAFSSIDFADSVSMIQLKLSVPPQMKETMIRNDLEESYTAFVRQCADRLRNRGPLFPGEFLNNIRRDTASFSLPYFSMFKAISDAYSGSVATAREEITNIFRTCTEEELSARFDQLRVCLDMRSRAPRPDVMKVLDEAAAAERAGTMELASERYREAARIAPDFAYASFRWGMFFKRSGDPIRAQTFFERAYQADTSYLSAYRESYSFYRKTGNYKAMIDVLTRALGHGNDFWEINFNLGLAHMGDSAAARAIKHFERALDLNPRNYMTCVQLGLAHQSARDFQKSRDYFNRAIFIDPIRPEAVEYLNKLNELQKNAR
jgi:Tfp pilus assembly protein PilF